MSMPGGVGGTAAKAASYPISRLIQIDNVWKLRRSDILNLSDTTAGHLYPATTFGVYMTLIPNAIIISSAAAD